MTIHSVHSLNAGGLRRRFTCGLAALLGGVLPALAQETLPGIVVFADQAPTEAPRVGASVTVLAGEELRAKNIPTVADALRSVPGVSVAQSGGRGTLTTVSIRGSDARNVLVLIDGIEVNQLGFPGFDFADLPTDDIERIEVIRGPQSGIYGSNAHAGVVAIVTRSGKGLAKPVVEGKIEGGSRATLGGYANVRGAAGPFYGSATFSDYSTRGYNIARFGSEADGSRANVFTAKGGVDLTPYLNVEGVVRHTERKTETDPQDFNFGSPTSGFVVDGQGGTQYKSTAGRLGSTLTLFDGRWIQTANVKTFDEHTRGFGDARFFGTAFGADGMRTTVDYKSTVKLDTNVAGGEQHTISILTDNRREDYVQTSSPTHYIKERTGLAGEYVLDLPTNTTLSSAVRQDWNSAFQDVTTWRFAASQRFPAFGTRLHASTGKGVTDPDVFQLFGSTFNLPNPGLSPEQSVGWDAGVEQSFFERRVVTDVTFFETEFTNKIELTFDPARRGFIYVNGTGAAHRRGVETSATVQWLDWLTTTATYTFTHAETSAGDPEVRRPPHSASFEATARFLDNRAKATFGVVYNSVRKDFFFGATGTTLVDLPGATVARASLSYDVTPSATIFARAENLFDKRYEEVFSYRAPPFGAYAGLKVRFE
jgi:vitamin B12 transporter